LALGHFHNSFERQIKEGPLVANPGAIERFSKAEALEQKGFYWVELGENATVAFEKLPSRPIEERVFHVTADMKNLKDLLVNQIQQWADPEKMLEVRLIGQTTAEEFLRLRPNELYNQFYETCFSLYLNRSELQLDTLGPLISEQIESPIESYRKRIESQIEKTNDETTRVFLQLVKDEGSKYLSEAE
jgi:DNA repair exonuclease SbcCD nuclease subunit